MIKRLAFFSAMFVLLSGCYMVPMAFIGPAASSFSTASIVQSAVTTSANYMIKKSTGKTIGEHAINAIKGQNIKHSYFPETEEVKLILPKKLNTD